MRKRVRWIPRVEQVIVSLNSSQDLVLIATADGTLAADIRPLVRLNVSVIMVEGDRREQGYAGGGARQSLEYFTQSTIPSEIAQEAVRQGRILLEAESAPAGAMPVVLGPGWPGVSAARGGRSRFGRRLQPQGGLRILGAGR